MPPPAPGPGPLTRRQLLRAPTQGGALLGGSVAGLGALESTLVTPYPVPAHPQAQPGQEPGTAPTPSGPVACPT